MQSVNNKLNILVIGSGSMGTALAKCLYDNGGTNITIYGIDEKELQDLKKGQNSKYFKNNVKLPHFRTENNFKKALKNQNLILLATPSIVLEQIIKDINTNLTQKTFIINASKGFFPNTKKLIHEYLLTCFAKNIFVQDIFTISGPSHAEEMIEGKETWVDLVTTNLNNAQKIIALFQTKYFKLIPQFDIMGSQVGASFKNVLAIACGIYDSQKQGINAKSALIYHALSDLKILIRHFKGHPDTILSLSNIGDILATCFSSHSRNYTFGIEFSKTHCLTCYRTTEGLSSLKTFEKIRLNEKIELPFIQWLFNYLFNEIHKPFDN